MSDNIPKSFDWVRARAECDDYILFAKLREAVRSSCQSALEFSKQKSELAGIVFEGDEGTPNFFSVTRRQGFRSFSLEADRITVRNLKNAQLHEAKALLVGESCLLEVGGKLMNPADFARLVLEDFFFSPSG